MSLRDYVTQYAVRGACTCGQCIDAPPNPEKLQPTGHTVDLVFFKVAANAQATGDKDYFLKLAKVQYPQWFDGKEHNYLEIGADMGDQGIALLTMGYGALLGVWELLTPSNMLPDIDRDLALDLAGRGMITIRTKEPAS